ncbi:hypothetical protein RRG08_048137 [Elysia crispata]|uniref:Uncharacterized protein n=1 Tax=Elysia crispata TaxID=231223 RepID=A0AAE0ZJ78_9GAST|nr:hypothetical protein RRG08_048137 [Elysia crispata]
MLRRPHGGMMEPVSLAITHWTTWWLWKFFKVHVYSHVQRRPYTHNTCVKSLNESYPGKLRRLNGDVNPDLSLSTSGIAQCYVTDKGLTLVPVNKDANWIVLLQVNRTVAVIGSGFMPCGAPGATKKKASIGHTLPFKLTPVLAGQRSLRF